jgi:hypothetical protein
MLAACAGQSEPSFDYSQVLERVDDPQPPGAEDPPETDPHPDADDPDQLPRGRELYALTCA